jgi:hypothetical protein
VPADRPDRWERFPYFRAYYEAHREAILAKNRAWNEAHKERLAALRRERARRRREGAPPPEPARCVDCGAPTVRAERCQRCHQRLRYHTDPAYRARRLAANRRSARRRRAAGAEGAGA